VFLVAQARGNHPMVPLSLRPHWPASRYDAHRRTDHADGTDRRAIPTWGSVLFQYPVPWGIT
jgi:hypothetical protein